MRKLKPIAILCFFTGMLFSGQTGKIAGTVTDASSGGALVGCNVLVKGTSQGASTDANGEYFIINLSPGSYDLEFSMIGYAAYTAEGVSVNIDVTTPVNAAVSTEAVAMSGIVVTAEQPTIENTLTSSKQIVDASVFANQGINSVNDLVATLPGVTTTGEGELHLRGGRTGEELYLVDGASTNNALFSGNAIPVNPGAIQEMELLTGTFNAEYGQAMSGVFNVALKEPVGGLHANVSYRMSSGGPGHHVPDGQADIYDEYDIMFNSSPGDNPNGKVDKKEFGKDPFTIMDFGASYGGGPFGLLVSFRDYNDPGRLPGMDDAYQNMTAKGTFKVGSSMKLGAELMTLNRERAYDPTYDPMKIDGDAGKLLMYNWKYAMGQFPRSEENALQFGLNLDYTFSPSSYLTVHFDNLTREQEDGAKDADGNFVDFSSNKKVTKNSTYNNSEGPNHTMTWGELTGITPDSATIFIGEGNTETISGTVYSADADGFISYPTGDSTSSQGLAWFDSENVYGHYFKHKETATNMEFTYVNQINSRHQIKAGFDYTMYNLRRDGVDVWYGRTVGTEEHANILQNQDIPDVKPTEMAVYAQDRMEFDDMVVNVGIRYDMFDPAVADGKFEGPEAFDMSKRSAAEVKSSISPRLGVSHPVGDNLAFRYGFGSFVQRPSFYDLYENYLIQGDGGTESGYYVYIGNPDMDPQKTTIYEMGMQYAPMDGYKIDFSGYYKDISNLVAAQEFTLSNYVDDNAGTYLGDNQQFTYTGAHYIGKTSKHFGSVRGIETSLGKTSGSLTARISYTYALARGTSSDRVNQGSGSFSATDNSWNTNILYVNTLAFSRPHVLNGYVDYRMDMGGMIDQIGLNLSFNQQSGLPYSTYAAAAFAFNERSPSTLDTKLKAELKLNVGPVSPTVFLLIDNLLNRENVVAIADPTTYFDESESNYQNAAGPRNNLAAYGAPMTIHFGFSVGL